MHSSATPTHEEIIEAAEVVQRLENLRRVDAVGLPAFIYARGWAGSSFSRTKIAAGTPPPPPHLDKVVDLVPRDGLVEGLALLRRHGSERLRQVCADRRQQMGLASGSDGRPVAPAALLPSDDMSAEPRPDSCTRCSASLMYLGTLSETAEAAAQGSERMCSQSEYALSSSPPGSDAPGVPISPLDRWNTRSESLTLLPRPAAPWLFSCMEEGGTGSTLSQPR